MSLARMASRASLLAILGLGSACVAGDARPPLAYPQAPHELAAHTVTEAFPPPPSSRSTRADPRWMPPAPTSAEADWRPHLGALPTPERLDDESPLCEHALHARSWAGFVADPTSTPPRTALRLGVAEPCAEFLD